MARDSAHDIHPEEILKAYTLGYFPMARTHDDPAAVWVLPQMRGILPMADCHVPKKLKKFLRTDPFEVTTNQCFDAVLSACAARGKGPTATVRAERSETWINDQIREAYGELHRMGFAHSLECWAGGELVGGLYGLALGGVFFGESMFSRKPNASKTAFVHLMGRMRMNNFTLLDTQFYTDHLSQFGVQEVPNTFYQLLLQDALTLDCQFPEVSSADASWSTSRVLQSITQTS
ncbi:MAG: leucyl/phenylalanyl-tRNA--protein transferase [Pseudomonadota bacterium]